MTVFRHGLASFELSIAGLEAKRSGQPIPSPLP